MFPVTAYHKNIIFNNIGEAFAIYRLRTYPYAYFSQDHQSSVNHRFEEILHGTRGRGQILSLCEEIRLDESSYAANANISVNSEEAKRHVQSARNVLTWGARRRRRYLILQIPLKQEGDIKSMLLEAREAVLSAVTTTPSWIVSPARTQAAVDAEEILFGRLHQDCLRANYSDIDFIIRRAVKHRGIFSLSAPVKESGIFTPGRLAAFIEGGYISEKINHLVVRCGDETTYQSYVIFSDIPMEVPEINNEWLASLDTEIDPVDAVLHFTVERPHTALGKVKSKKRYLRGQIEESISGTGDVSGIEEHGLYKGKSLETKLAQGMPLVSMSVVFAMAAADLKKLQTSSLRLMERFSSSGYQAVRPLGSQSKCFYSFFPGAKMNLTPIQCDPGYVSSSGPLVSLELGDDTGMFIGWSGSFPVFWMPGQAAQKLNRTNAILVSGTLGSGKSVLGKTLCYLSRISGGYVLVLDPKNNEYSVFKKLFPEMHQYDLSPQGSMHINPFVLSPDIRRAKSIALDYLTLALNVNDENEARRTVCAQTVERVFSLPIEKRNMFSALDEVKKIIAQNEYPHLKEEALQCMLLLESLKDSALGRLIFGEASADKISPFTVINLSELPLPQQKSSFVRMTESERHGQSLIYLAAAMVREAAFRLPQHVLKTLLFDEAWMLTNLPEGVRLLEEVVRLGRTYNIVPIMVTQNTTDVEMSNVIRNNLGYAACFRATDMQEIKANIGFLGADPAEGEENGTLRQVFPNLNTGWCVFRDAMGRIGQLCVAPKPDYLLDIFDTRPLSKKAANKEQ